jgi:hypothetical protein
MSSTLARVSYILNVAQMPLFIIGLIGNVLSVVVFSRKTFRKNSISIYCRALAIADSVVIVKSLTYFIGSFFLGRSFQAESLIYCKIYSLIQTGIAAIPSWILVGFSIDKMLCVTRSKRLEFWLKKIKIHLGIVFAIVIINCLAYVFVPIYFQLLPKITTSGNVTIVSFSCGTSDIKVFQVIGALFLYETSVLPFVLMMITTVVTILILVNSRKRMEEAMATAENMRVLGIEKRKSRDVNYAINSIVLNILFIVFQVPYVLATIYPSQDPIFTAILNPGSHLWFYFNFCMPFFTYLFSNYLFRRELRKMLISWKKQTRVENSTIKDTNNKKSTINFKSNRSS